MESQEPRLYRTKEFAAKVGVTARTLHFYDRLGLLKPAARSDSGYRLYGDAELNAWSKSLRCASSPSVSNKSANFSKGRLSRSLPRFACSAP